MARPSRRGDALTALGVLATCFAAYVATLSPGLPHPGGDSPELTVVAATLGLAHPTGYPIFTWAGFLFTHLVPVGDVAYRMNLMSATLGAVAVTLLYLIARRLGLRPVVAVFAALLFGVSPAFWSQTVIAEVYAANACMVALVLWLGLRWADRVAQHPARADRDFVWFAFAYGLSLGTHLSNLGFAPAFAFFVLRADRSIVRRPRTVVLAVAAFLLGAAQFGWLPLRAGAPDLHPNEPPDTPARFYAYTLGAFSNLRFAFALDAVSDRIAWYVTFAAENFSWAGLALGVAGMWVLVSRNALAFWLLALMWAVHVTFFSQLFVPDPDPYFITSNLVVALFAGFGADALYGALVGRRRAPAAALVLGGVLLVALAAEGFRMNDRSDDTVVGDFYRSVFAFLPPGSVLVGRGGAFGSDLTYFHRLYRVRPDVLVPDRTWRQLPPGVPVFTTPEEHPVGALVQFPERAWYVPVIRGARHDLTLYRVSAGAPPLVVQDAAPDVRVDRTLSNVTLVGYDRPVVVDRRIRLKTYWRALRTAHVVVATRANDMPLESHELGFGNLPRFRSEMGFGDGGIVVEEFDVVLPASFTSGTHALQIGTIDFTTGTVTPRWTDLGEITVP